MIVVSAKDLTKAYGTDVILDKVSFHINKGDRVGIIGINGAGKSTLLKMLTGEMSCESGDYFISADTKIGYLKQDGEFESENTVIEEVDRIFDRFAKMEQEMERLLQQIESKEIPDEILLEKYDALQEEYKQQGGYTYKSEITGILSSMAFGEESYGKKISSLSGGERTRLALACLLLKKPDILFLDEPTTYLDIRYQLEILELVKKLNEEFDITIVMVLHDINQTIYFSDKIIGLQGGHVAIEGAPDQVITEESIQKLYGVHLMVTRVNGSPVVAIQDYRLPPREK